VTIASRHYAEHTDVRQTNAPPKVLRKDIQGLRALAVLAVIADHLFHWPAGGFIGVDVFFVISGFLITGLLLREYERSGTISFVGFYKRRARRIVPAAALVLLVTTLTAFMVFNLSRATQTAWDSVWSFLFAANWRFAVVGTDYFQADGPVSPLQHFWSLAVEEQFYFVWPWLMLAIFVFAGRWVARNTRIAHRLTAITMAVIVVASFVWSISESANSPTWAYFSTFSRTWELGIGALLAVFATRLKSLAGWARVLLAWMGLAGIIASVFFLDSSLPFPGPWAAAPVLSTALVILAGSGGTPRFVWPLTNTVAGYLGKISYSLYLWHFPVIILLASVLPEGTLLYQLVALLLMFAISTAAFHLVEARVLASAWLRDLSRLERRELSREKRRRRRETYSRNALIGLSLVATSVFVLAYFAVIPRPVVSSYVPQRSEAVESAVELSLGPVEQRVVDLRAANASRSWPDFNPAIDNLVDQRVPQWTEHGCLNVSDENMDKCVYGSVDSSATVAVVGDSIATSWLPGIIAALEPHGYRIQALTLESCPFARTPVSAGGATTVYDRCVAHQDWVAEQLNALRPQLIIVSDSFLSLDRLMSGAEGDAAAAEWRGAYAAALATLPGDSKVVSLATPPGAPNLQKCYTPISSPSDCSGRISDNWQMLQAAEKAASDERGTAYIDTKRWFCQAEKCPSFVGTTAMYADASHLTSASSSLLAPVIEEAMRELEYIGDLP